MEQIPTDSIVVLTDGDEAWDPEQLGSALEYLRSHEEIRALWSEAIMFWGDFEHIIQTDLQVIRIFRKEEKDQYLCVESGNLGDFHNRQDELEFLALEWSVPLQLYHLGWVRQARRLFQKTLYTYRYNQAFPSSELYSQLLGLSDEEIGAEILLNHHNFTRRLPPGMVAKFYPGPWPEPLRSHPFWGMTEREIFRECDYQDLLGELWSCALSV